MLTESMDKCSTSFLLTEASSSSSNQAFTTFTISVPLVPSARPTRLCSVGAGLHGLLGVLARLALDLLAVCARKEREGFSPGGETRRARGGKREEDGPRKSRPAP